MATDTVGFIFTHNITRPYDYLYDTLTTFSTPKDFYKEVLHSQSRTAQFAVCPVFPCMFSDLPRLPRKKLVMRNADRIKNIDQLWENINKPRIAGGGLPQASVDISGADRALFFKSPIVKICPDIIPDHELPVEPKYSNVKKLYRTRCTQTIYRESSAQTLPWQPVDYIIPPDNLDPELLKLGFLRNNLPAGVHEIELIKRARIKRAWEKLIPEGCDEDSLTKRRQIIEAIETDEWAFREQEINDIQNLRLELLELMLEELLEETAHRSKAKISRMSERLNKDKENKISKIKQNKQRELRRLYKQHMGISTRYHESDIVTEYADYKSELYGPMMRHGEHPKRAHEVIKPSKYTPKLLDIETISTFPRWLDIAIKMKNDIKPKHRQLCIRETKWTEPVLRELHDELRNLRVKQDFSCSFRKSIIKEEIIDDTIRIDEPSQWMENENLAAIVLQSVIRGRATQSMIFEGRDKCRELIVELQHTFALQEHHQKRIHEQRMKVMNQQRFKQVETSKRENLLEILRKLEGTVVGTLLDFLNKELRRLLDERKAHAMALIFERDRHKKEAAEAGRRQVEERRRREHDEMFKQVMKVHQDTVDLYLQDIILEGTKNVSKEQAREYVEKLAAQIDEAECEALPQTFLQKEELIADMVHHFMIPEIEKTFHRRQIKQRQRKHLKNAHDCIFNELNQLPKSVEEEDKFLGLLTKTPKK